MIFCDNMATVCATGSARAEDPLIRGALGELWWWSSTRDIQLAVRHKQGVNMEVPDMLSRAYVSKAGWEKFKAFKAASSEEEIHVADNVLKPPISL